MSTNQIQALFGGLLALLVIVAIVVYGYQGDQAARTLLFSIGSAAGVAYVAHKSFTSTK